MNINEQAVSRNLNKQSSILRLSVLCLTPLEGDRWGMSGRIANYISPRGGAFSRI